MSDLTRRLSDLNVQAVALNAEIERLRAINAAAERDLSDTQAAMAEIQEINAELLAALEEFTECAMYDPMMEGPRFKGWQRSSLDRCLPRARAAIAKARQP